MENAFVVYFMGILKACGWQIVMFFLTGIAFELAAEFVKATLYPKNKGKECPRWLGMALGAVITVVYLAMAYMASSLKGFTIPGGTIFLPVWFIFFYVYQFKAIRVAKWLRDKMFPTLKDPDKSYTKKPKEKKLTNEELLALLKAQQQEA